MAKSGFFLLAASDVEVVTEVDPFVIGIIAIKDLPEEVPGESDPQLDAAGVSDVAADILGEDVIALDQSGEIVVLREASGGVGEIPVDAGGSGDIDIGGETGDKSEDATLPPDEEIT